jgi:hypothetical protein
VAECPNLEDLQKLWEVGEGHRHVGATKMNAGTKHAAGPMRTPAPSRPSLEAGFDMPCTSAKLDCRLRGEITGLITTRTD